MKMLRKIDHMSVVLLSFVIMTTLAASVFSVYVETVFAANARSQPQNSNGLPFNSPDACGCACFTCVCSPPPVHSTGGTGKQGVQPQCGGGGGGPPPPPPFTCRTVGGTNTIEGCVTDPNFVPVSGIYVYLISCYLYGLSTDWTTTDSNGHFVFHQSQIDCIGPNVSYAVSVNGVTPVTNCGLLYQPNGVCPLLGQAAACDGHISSVCADHAWGQWVQDVVTDGGGYGYTGIIQVSPGQQVNVPIAALYPDTKFGSASFTYSATQTLTVDQAVGTSIEGNVVSIGFKNNIEEKFTVTTATTFFTQKPVYVEIPYYAIGYSCGGSHALRDNGWGWSCSAGLQSVGLSTNVPSGGLGEPATTEYVDPNPLALGSYCQFPLANTAGNTWTYSESASVKWTTSSHLAATVVEFGVSSTIDYTVSAMSGASVSLSYTITNNSGQQLTFRVYSPGGSCDSNGLLVAGSPEIHIWDWSGLG